MPVTGPSYSKERADEAIEAIMELLRDQYNIRKFPPMYFEDAAERDRAEDDEALKKVIHNMFMHDAWEGW